MDMITVLFLLGGKGSRFGDTLPKQFHPLGDKKVYQHALSTFEQHPSIDEILLIVPPEGDIPLPESHRKIVGGATRQESVYRGLCACSSNTTHVMVHDGVRPFVSPRIIDAHIRALQQSQAINTCIPSKDTLNQIAADEILAIPDRTLYMRGQTPQTFAYPLLLQAHETTAKTNATDDCQLVLDLPHPVSYILGEDANFKITTALDLAIAKNFYYTRQQQ